MLVYTEEISPLPRMHGCIMRWCAFAIGDVVRVVGMYGTCRHPSMSVCRVDGTGYPSLCIKTLESCAADDPSTEWCTRAKKGFTSRLVRFVGIVFDSVVSIGRTAEDGRRVNVNVPDKRGT